MFNKTGKSSDEEAGAEAPSLLNANRPAPRTAPSLLGTDLTITGDIVSEGDLQIDGKVIGDIKSVSLTVGEKAQIKGEIVCDKALIHGAVSGRVTAKDVYLSKSAKIVGDIHHDLVAIERGAFVDGQIRRRQSGQQSDQQSDQQSGQQSGQTATKPAAAMQTAKPETKEPKASEKPKTPAQSTPTRPQLS